MQHPPAPKATSDVEVAIAAVQEGDRVVRQRFGARVERVEKNITDGDFTTNADIEAEAAMLAVLRRERPQDTVVGEEGGRTGSSNSARTWLIDSLCGKANYLARMQVAAVNVALCRDGQPTTAAVADPFSEELYWTDGHSACRRADADDAPLTPTSDSRLVELNLNPPFTNAPAFRASDLAGHSEFSERFQARVVASSIALAWVASGQRAAYVTDGDVRGSVHLAAGLALVEAAGCIVTDLFGRRWGGGATGLIAAADRNVHEDLLRMIRKRLK